jgi:hypothetical protein
MHYNVWGSLSPYVEPNAPLNDTCAPPTARNSSAVAAIESCNTAGMPANQIMLRVASYGHSFTLSPSDVFVRDSNTELAAYPRSNSLNQVIHWTTLEALTLVVSTRASVVSEISEILGTCEGQLADHGWESCSRYLLLV